LPARVQDRYNRAGVSMQLNRRKQALPHNIYGRVTALI
jgi:hypothetical protein